MIYLDSAASTLKPKCVVGAIAHFYEHEYATVNRSAYSRSFAVTEKYEGVRSQVANFIKARSSDEIVFTKGTTESLNLLASSLGKSLGPGDEVVISELEHHSNIVPWQMMCKERGATLRIIPMTPSGELGEYHFSEKTKVVSIAHISNVTGAVHPIKEIAKAAHSVGAIMVVDGAQAVGHIPINVQELMADFYCFSGHKMYGPTGIGILYGKYELLEKLPPYQGGGDMIESVSFEKTTYQKPPLKFEAGTPPIAQVIGLGQAINYIEQTPFDDESLVNYALERLTDVRLIGTPKKRGALISFVIEGIHHADIAAILDSHNIAIRTGHLCAQPAMEAFGISGACRISFGRYNTTSDIDTFIKRLEAARSLISSS